MSSQQLNYFNDQSQRDFDLMALRPILLSFLPHYLENGVANAPLQRPEESSSRPFASRSGKNKAASRER